jgi:hypothetical protein
VEARILEGSRIGVDGLIDDEFLGEDSDDGSWIV